MDAEGLTENFEKGSISSKMAPYAMNRIRFPIGVLLTL
jgi:hypothetical protein